MGNFINDELDTSSFGSVSENESEKCFKKSESE